MNYSDLLGPPELMQELTSVAARALKAEKELNDERRTRHFGEQSLAVALADEKDARAAADTRALRAEQECIAAQAHAAKCEKRCYEMEEALASAREREAQLREALAAAKAAPAPVVTLPAPDPLVKDNLLALDLKLDSLLAASAERPTPPAPEPRKPSSYTFDLKYDGAGVVRSILATPA